MTVYLLVYRYTFDSKQKKCIIFFYFLIWAIELLDGWMLVQYADTLFLGVLLSGRHFHKAIDKSGTT
jgi:hypothetical protein